MSAAADFSGGAGVPAGRAASDAPLLAGDVGLYAFLFVAAVYFLLPLYVMVVTSLKPMDEIRLGNIFAPPLEITFEPWVKAGLGLHGPRLQRR